MKQYIPVWFGYAALILVLVGASFFAGQVLAGPAPAVRAQEDAPNIPNAPGLAAFYCPSVTNIAAFNNRIHLRCSTYNGLVLYYAYANDPANATVANQMLAAGNTAYALGRPVWMYYYSDSSYNPPGCNTTDCRGLWGVSAVQ